MNLDHACTPSPALPRCECGSYAINDHPARTLCDRCWRDKEIERLQAIVDKMLSSLGSCMKSCEYMHHEKKDRHEYGEPCPVESRVRLAVAAAGKAREI